MVWLSSPSQNTSVSFSEKNRKVLLVIAHPDDEVMFFTPVLLTLMESNAQITVLCLSNGNYEGMGTIRTNELIKSLSMLLAERILLIETIVSDCLLLLLRTRWPSSSSASQLTFFSIPH